MTLAIHDLPLFAAAALLVNLTPGPDMLFVIGTSAARGPRAGVLAALGVGAGCLVHITLAAIGLSAVLAASATAFAVVKWVGAGYLVWMGLSMLLGSRRRAAPQGDAPRRAHVFWQGALTNALNPKVALFFLAFLPQFILPSVAGQALAFASLGMLFAAGGTVINVAVAVLTGSLRARLARRGAMAGAGAWLQRAAGALFIALGVKLALSSR